MNATAAISTTTGRPIAAGDVELWVEQRGAGPDVLLLAGLSDPAEPGASNWTGSPTATAHRVRQPRRRPFTAAARRVHGATWPTLESRGGSDACCSHDIQRRPNGRPATALLRARRTTRRATPPTDTRRRPDVVRPRRPLPPAKPDRQLCLLAGCPRHPSTTTTPTATAYMRGMPS